MAETRIFRDRKVCRDLKEGSCVLALNSRETILRLWDCYGSYTMFAPAGETFDIPLIQEWLKKGIGIVLPNLREMDNREEQAVAPHKRRVIMPKRKAA